MTTENTIPTKSKKPALLAYLVRDGKDEQSYFTKIGAAWSHGDGLGFTVQLESIPLDGRIVLRRFDDTNR